MMGPILEPEQLPRYNSYQIYQEPWFQILNAYLLLISENLSILIGFWILFHLEKCQNDVDEEAQVNEGVKS